jgi:pyridoxal phosphate enzyme (YggS family)
MNDLAGRLADVRRRIAAAAARAGRQGDDVRLIAVTKTWPAETVQSLIEQGIRDFGENQIQEALDKIGRFHDRRLHWHFIGHLQSNKCRFVPGNFDWLHSVDSEKIARRIAEAAEHAERVINLLVQVNVAGDPAKHGVSSTDLFALIDRILAMQSKAIHLRGLMTLGYRRAGEDAARRTFAGLHGLLDQCRSRFGDSFTELSMGMSDDYELAVEEGATMVRVGTALLGERNVGQDSEPL